MRRNGLNPTRSWRASRRSASDATARFGTRFGGAWALLAALLLCGAARAQPLERGEGAIEIRVSADAPWRPVSPGEALEPGVVSLVGALAATLDRALVGRAVDNLLSNAVKYSSQGTRVAVRLEVGADDRLELVVADEGYGLDPRQQRRVFERDYRVPDGPHARERGSGLGLYVVRQVAEAHGGRVTVASQPGVGSTFRLELPRRVGAPRLEKAW